MRCRTAAAVALAAVALAASGCAMRSKPVVPPQNVRMDADVLEEFSEGIAKYVKLHKELTARIPLAQ